VESGSSSKSVFIVFERRRPAHRFITTVAKLSRPTDIIEIVTIPSEDEKQVKYLLNCKFVTIKG